MNSFTKKFAEAFQAQYGFCPVMTINSGVMKQKIIDFIFDFEGDVKSYRIEALSQLPYTPEKLLNHTEYVSYDYKLYKRISSSSIKLTAPWRLTEKYQLDLEYRTLKLGLECLRQDVTHTRREIDAVVKKYKEFMDKYSGGL